MIILFVGGIIVTQFISMSMTSAILLAIKVYVGIELFLIFDSKELHILWKIVFIIIFNIGWVPFGRFSAEKTERNVEFLRRTIIISHCTCHMDAFLYLTGSIHFILEE